MQDESNRLACAFSARILQPASFLPLTPQVAFRMIPAPGEQEVDPALYTSSRRKSAGAHGSRTDDHPIRILRQRLPLTQLACLMGLAALALFAGSGRIGPIDLS